MPTLHFTGQQSTADFDLLLSAELDGKPIGVRVSSAVVQDIGLVEAQVKAKEKAAAGLFEPGGGIRVTTSDFEA